MEEYTNLKQLTALLLAALVLTLSKINRLIVDGDTFWAIKVGEWISLNREVPKVDSFSWAAYGNPWVAHEWLYDFLIYKFYTSLGYYGIVLFVFIGSFTVFYFLWKLYVEEEKNPVLTLVIFTIVIFMLNTAMVARPQLYGYVFFVYFFYVLYRKKHLLWTLPPVTVIWANMHGSVLLGIAMVLLQIIYDTLYRYIEEKRLFIKKELIAAAFLVPLSSLINPYGVELWKASLMQITYYMNKQIIEWQPPDFKDQGWLFMYLVIIITTVLVSFSNKGIIDKRKFYLLAIYLFGTFYEAITGVRYYPYLVICWGLFILTLLPRELFSKKSWNKNILIILSFLLIIMVINTGKPPTTIEEAVEKSTWPIEAVNHLENKRIYNEYMWGGFLIYKNIPVFIDGRADVYWKDCDVFEDYSNINQFKKDPLDILTKYNVEQVFIPVNNPLDIYLKRAGVIEKYRDETAVIYNLKE